MQICSVETRCGLLKKTLWGHRSCIRWQSTKYATVRPSRKSISWGNMEVSLSSDSSSVCLIRKKRRKMARMNKRDPRAARNLRRVSFVREVKQTFLIVCEGVNTEPDYFNAFRLTSANIKAVGQGINTVGLVQKALRIREEERKKGRDYDQCWVVFDKDDFPDNDFNRAIALAQTGGMKVAYSNQAFEYWFLLHYNLFQGPMHRNMYAEKLSGLLGVAYSKEAGFAGQVFRILADKQGQAIRNAKAIMCQMENIPPAQAESSTTVHLLVEELNKYI